ncbi:MAG: hypothetical protein QF600_04410, partial [Verrucomicrobiota bacterium]|nr:hypothetical protein [Verrucomicrobiota bacterium]
MSARTLGLLFAALASSAFALPHWIWQAGQAENVSLQHTFQAPEKIKSARLRMIADFANVQLGINGKPVAVAEMFGPVVELDIRLWLHPGKNTISLQSISHLETPAVALELVIVDIADKKTTIATSPRWKGTKSLGDLAREKWWNVPALVIDETDDYDQWKRASKAKAGTDPASFEVLPGFRAELLRSAGKEENSW